MSGARYLLRGFTLPIVLMAVSGAMLLLLSLFSLLSVEVGLAQVSSDDYRAELAAESALAEVESLLHKATREDTFLVTKFDSEVLFKGKSSLRSYQMLGVPSQSKEGEDFVFDWLPLYSSSQSERVLKILSESPRRPFLSHEEGQRTLLSLEPWQKPAVVNWRWVRDPSSDEVVARFAYFVEDQQAYLDAAVVGNDFGERGEHSSVNFEEDSPAPGRSIFVREESQSDRIRSHSDRASVRLHSLFDQKDGVLLPRIFGLRRDLDQGGDLETYQGIFDEGQLMSLLSAEQREKREVSEGRRRLSDPVARAVEENLTFLLRPYEERAVVPYASGVSRSAVGRPMVNLNRLLSAADRSAAVEEFAEMVQDSLPHFASVRRGGFPDEYLESLAASALDYADRDSESTLKQGSYRGIDAYPLVSEFAVRFRWDDVKKEEGRKKVLLSAEVFVELWNMTNVAVSGAVQGSYETKYAFSLGATPQIVLGSDEVLDDVTVASHDLIKEGDYYFFPKQSVELKPNEMRLISLGEVKYEFDVGADDVFVASPIALDGDNGKSGYRLRWNGQLVDESRGNLERRRATIHFPSNSFRSPRQKVRATVPGHSYGRWPNFKRNMGDPRMSYYIDEVQSANKFPVNWSPERRNVRLEIFGLGEEPKGASKIHARVFPSQWPDGGHDEVFGTIGEKWSDLIARRRADSRIVPDDPMFFVGRVEPRLKWSPSFLSNRGFFISETELGHVYDPVMWDSGAGIYEPEKWGDINRDAVASLHYGGGNTLRVGRLDHSRFRQSGVRASQLLDLFHVGHRSPEKQEGETFEEALERSRSGVTRKIHGQVNINTAKVDVLRVLLAGMIRTDSELSRVDGDEVSGETKAPKVAPVSLSPLVDVVSKEIVAQRPYASVSEVANLQTVEGKGLFGDRSLWENGKGVQWSDRAAETLFSRFYHAATVRSRNFKVTVIGQSLASDGRPLATHRRVYRVFIDPGERDAEGNIVPSEMKFEILSNHAK